MGSRSQECLSYLLYSHHIRSKITTLITYDHMSDIDGHMSDIDGHMSDIDGHMSDIDGLDGETRKHDCYLP